MNEDKKEDEIKKKNDEIEYMKVPILEETTFYREVVSKTSNVKKVALRKFLKGNQIDLEPYWRKKDYDRETKLTPGELRLILFENFDALKVKFGTWLKDETIYSKARRPENITTIIANNYLPDLIKEETKNYTRSIFSRHVYYAFRSSLRKIWEDVHELPLNEVLRLHPYLKSENVDYILNEKYKSGDKKGELKFKNEMDFMNDLASSTNFNTWILNPLLDRETYFDDEEEEKRLLEDIVYSGSRGFVYTKSGRLFNINMEYIPEDQEEHDLTKTTGRRFRRGKLWISGNQMLPLGIKELGKNIVAVEKEEIALQLIQTRVCERFGFSIIALKGFPTRAQQEYIKRILETDPDTRVKLLTDFDMQGLEFILDFQKNPYLKKTIEEGRLSHLGLNPDQIELLTSREEVETHDWELARVPSKKEFQKTKKELEKMEKLSNTIEEFVNKYMPIDKQEQFKDFIRKIRASINQIHAKFALILETNPKIKELFMKQSPEFKPDEVPTLRRLELDVITSDAIIDYIFDDVLDGATTYKHVSEVETRDHYLDIDTGIGYTLVDLDRDVVDDDDMVQYYVFTRIKTDRYPEHRPYHTKGWLTTKYGNLKDPEFIDKVVRQQLNKTGLKGEVDEVFVNRIVVKPTKKKKGS